MNTLRVFWKLGYIGNHSAGTRMYVPLLPRSAQVGENELSPQSSNFDILGYGFGGLPMLGSSQDLPEFDDLQANRWICGGVTVYVGRGNVPGGAQAQWADCGMLARLGSRICCPRQTSAFAQVALVLALGKPADIYLIDEPSA